MPKSYQSGGRNQGQESGCGAAHDAQLQFGTRGRHPVTTAATALEPESFTCLGLHSMSLFKMGGAKYPATFIINLCYVYLFCSDFFQSQTAKLWVLGALESIYKSRLALI